MTMDHAHDDFRSVLASVDRRGRRQWVYAHIVPGHWRRRRAVVAYLVTALVLALPHLRLGGLPLLRIDLPHARYIACGQIFWPQDLSLVLLLVLIAIVATLLAVALAGRVICGWICPHNAMLEFLFRPIEALWEGPAHRRARQDRAGMRAGLLARKVGKWLCYALLCLVCATAIAALFTGADAIVLGLYIAPATHPAGALFAALLAAAMLFNFAWFREQTCTIVCPYGRLQSAMLDRHSLVPSYDAVRGEPRGKAAPLAIGDGGPPMLQGDCVDCRLCVSVCPTAIDIRNGSQLECIGCAACIDACDGVMDRLARPRGLIAYRSENQLAGQPRVLVRARTVLYAVVLLGLLGVTATRIALRSELEVMRLRVGAMPTVEHGAGGVTLVRQEVTLSLSNRTGVEQRLRLALPPELGATLTLPEEPIVLAPDQRREVSPSVGIPAELLHGRDRLTTLTITSSTGAHVELPITLRAP